MVGHPDRTFHWIIAKPREGSQKHIPGTGGSVASRGEHDGPSILFWQSPWTTGRSVSHTGLSDDSRQQSNDVHLNTCTYITKPYLSNIIAWNLIACTLCIALIKHHACTGDEIPKEAMVEEEPQAVEPDEPNDDVQGRPLCIPMPC